MSNNPMIDKMATYKNESENRYKNYKEIQIEKFASFKKNLANCYLFDFFKQSELNELVFSLKFFKLQNKSKYS